MVLFVLWPAVVSTHLVLTVQQPQPAVLISWLKCWVVLGLAFTLETLLARKVGEDQTKQVLRSLLSYLLYSSLGQVLFV